MSSANNVGSTGADGDTRTLYIGRAVHVRHGAGFHSGPNGFEADATLGRLDAEIPVHERRHDSYERYRVLSRRGLEDFEATLLPPSNGLPKPIIGLVAALSPATRRRALREETAGRTLIACVRDRQAADLQSLLAGAASVTSTWWAGMWQSPHVARMERPRPSGRGSGPK
jgi:hypothetical protein